MKKKYLITIFIIKLNMSINRINMKTLHKLPWFLYGAGISTISTVYLYFTHRPQPSFYIKSAEPPRI